MAADTREVPTVATSLSDVTAELPPGSHELPAMTATTEVEPMFKGQRKTPPPMHMAMLLGALAGGVPFAKNSRRVRPRKGQGGVFVPVQPRGEVGRNDLCPCGSGQKYKRCCRGKQA